jgi:RNA polymerase sigma-70 factor (ECF subfamily)
MDYTKLDDVALIGLIGRSHADALGELYDRYSRLVYSLALNTVGDHASAEEITLDTFARVWERASTYRLDRAKVSTWVTSIARYRAIDELRRRSVRPEQHSVGWADLPHSAEPRTNDLEETAQLRIDREQVRAAVATLPEEQKQALGLAYFRGYSQREIAEELGQPLGTIKTRIRLAMEKLRALLRPPETE